MVMHDQAEKLKVKFGSALSEEVIDNRIITIPGFKGRDFKEISEKNLAKIIEARLEEIFDYVLWEIKRSGYEDKLIGGIVLTGGGSLAHGYTSQIASPIYSTAVGLLSIAISNMEMELEEQVGSDQEVFDLDEENQEDKDGFLGKIFTYTKEFFATAQDSEF